MNEVNMMSYDDAVSVLGGYATAIKTNASKAYATMARNGVKNQAKLQYDGKTETMKGISFVYNNGEIDVSGTATAQAYTFPANSVGGGFDLEPGRKYVLTGMPAGTTGVSLLMRYNDGSNHVIATDAGSGAAFEFTQEMHDASNGYNLMINVASGTEIAQGGITIRPMIRYAEDLDAAFEKHALTNSELTAAVAAMKTSFQAGVDAVYDAVADKGSTPASHALVDIVSAIDNLPDNKYLTAVYSSDAINGSYTIPEDGTYLILCATSYGSTHSITIPQSAVIIDEQSDYDFAYGDGRGIETKILTLEKDDVIAFEQTWGSNWTGRSFIIFKITNISAFNNIEFDAVDDNTKTYTTVAGATKLIIGIGIGSGSNQRNNTTLNHMCVSLEGTTWGNGMIAGIYITDKSETFSFYGYDGGIGFVGVWEIS